MNKAFANLNFAKSVVAMAKDLENESQIALIQMAVADKRMKEVSVMISDVMNELIYSAEVVNKLANTVIQEKALNPLISDELITVIGQAGTDANNAVALCLVALESCYAAQASSSTAEATFALEYKESVKLYELLSGEEVPDLEPAASSNKVSPKEEEKDSIIEILEQGYVDAEALFNLASQISNDANEELAYAQDNLNRAQINLQSLQAGLAAAQAAAMAS